MRNKSHCNERDWMKSEMDLCGITRTCWAGAPKPKFTYLAISLALIPQWDCVGQRAASRLGRVNQSSTKQPPPFPLAQAGKASPSQLPQEVPLQKWATASLQELWLPCCTSSSALGAGHTLILCDHFSWELRAGPVSQASTRHANIRKGLEELQKMNPTISCRLLDSYQIPPCYSPWALHNAQSSGWTCCLHFNSPWARRHRWGRNTSLSSCYPFLLTLCLSPALGRPGVKLSPPVSCNGNASQTSQIPTEAQTARDRFSIRSYMVRERDHGRVGSLISEFQKEKKGVLGQDPQVYWAQILALLQLTKTDFREVILSPPISVPLLLHADNDPSYIWPWWRF